MENKEIIEGNKAIALFEGAFYEERLCGTKPYTYTLVGVNYATYNKDKEVVLCTQNKHILQKTCLGFDTETDKKGAFISLGKLKYHTSYDWLMPVVEKISKVHGISGLYNAYSKVTDALLMLDIEILFKAVTKFITWYNSN